MFTGEGPHWVYSWAFSSSWCPPRYGKIGFAVPVKEPQRGGTLCAVRAKLSLHHAREGDDAYRQFADMLGEGSSSKPRSSDAKSAAYAEFADRLGLDDDNREDDDKTKSVSKLSPKKVEIDPADYHIFDEMLERTGGRGTRPVKGAKPYSRHITRTSKISKKQRRKWDAMPAEVSTEAIHQEEDDGSATVPGLTEEEKAQAYAVMMEEFGPGSDYGVETWTPDDDVDESEPTSSQLMKPPERPGEARPVEPTIRATGQAPANDVGEQRGIQEHVELSILQPKPSRPTPDKATSLQAATENRESHKEETVDLSPPEVSAAQAAAQLDPETQFPESEEHIQLQAEQEIWNFEAQDLKSPPVRPVQGETTSERPHVPTEGKTMTLEARKFNANVETSEKVTASVMPKPQRRQEFLATSAVGGSIETTPRSNRRKGVTRRKRFTSEEPAVVLSNPKLVCQNE